jgi:tetratricopeptide (TPR) repeat protein
MRKAIYISTVLILLAANMAAQSQSRRKGSPTAKPLAAATEEEAEKQYQRWEARERAVRRATRLSDPKKRIEALERLRIDFPEDAEGPRIIDEGTLETYLKFWPQQTGKILALINRIVGSVNADETGVAASSSYDFVATKLVEAEILLDQAEKFAAQAVATFDERKYVERLKKTDKLLAAMVSKNRNAEPVLRTEPRSDEELAKKARAERARRFATLGRVYLKRGRTIEGEKILKEALEANPAIPEANVAMADLALKAGDHRAVVDYLAANAVRTPLKPESREQLETSYRKIHGGSLDGLEEMLDARYRLLMPNPIKVEHYQPTTMRTERVVLSEVFTGAGCVPCVGADLAFEAAMARYSNKNLLVLMYHLNRPLPDPMTNPASLARAAFYGAQRTPTFMIDGEMDTEGGAMREKSRVIYERIAPVIEKRLESAAEAQIKPEARLEGAAVKVKVTVDKITNGSKNLKLQIALAENELRYSGENLVRIHPMVVRKLAVSGGGFAIVSSRPLTVEHTFDLLKISAEIKAYLDDYEVNGDYSPLTFKEKKYKINAHNLSVVAFVQDEKSKRVLQSASCPVETAIAGARK